ncbi:hypothetical protein D3C81_2040160 [compost metagenome]
MAEAKEIADRRFHARFGFVVPIHAQHDFARQERFFHRSIGRHRHPDMLDATRTGDPANFDVVPGFNAEVILVASRAVVAGRTLAFALTLAGET